MIKSNIYMYTNITPQKLKAIDINLLIDHIDIPYKHIDNESIQKYLYNKNFIDTELLYKSIKYFIY